MKRFFIGLCFLLVFTQTTYAQSIEDMEGVIILSDDNKTNARHSTDYEGLMLEITETTLKKVSNTDYCLELNVTALNYETESLILEKNCTV